MAAMEALPAAEIERRLGELPGWSLDTSGDGGDAIRKTFAFPDFVHAIQFVNRLAEAAEDEQHHPDLDIRYNKVTIALTTHDAGGVTAKDFALVDHAERAASVARAAM